MKCHAPDQKATKDLSPSVATNHCTELPSLKVSTQLLGTALALYWTLLGWDNILIHSSSDSLRFWDHQRGQGRGHSAFLLGGSLLLGSFLKEYPPPTPLSPLHKVQLQNSWTQLLNIDCLQEQVSNLQFPDNGSVFYYRTRLVCISIIRQGTSPGSGIPFCLMTQSYSVVRSSAPTLQRRKHRTGQKAHICYQKDKTQTKLKLLCREGIIMMPVLLNVHFGTLKRKKQA